MPFSFLDRIFSVLFFSVNNFIPAEITLIDLGTNCKYYFYSFLLIGFTDFSPEASLLYRIDGGLSYISVEFEKNVVVLKFAGLEADSTFFCDFCSLIRIITRLELTDSATDSSLLSIGTNITISRCKKS